MPNIRGRARRGDVIVGVSSSRGGVTPKVLFAARISEKISCKQYFEHNARDGPSKYRYRFDNNYGINRYNEVSLKLKTNKSIQEIFYWYSRIPQNIGNNFEKEVVICKEYKTFFKRCGPRISSKFGLYLKRKQRDCEIPKDFESEIDDILAGEHEAEREPNRYDPHNPTTYSELRKLLLYRDPLQQQQKFQHLEQPPT